MRGQPHRGSRPDRAAGHRGDARRDRAQAAGRRAAPRLRHGRARQGQGRERQPGEVGIPGDDEPRDPHAAGHHPGLRRAAREQRPLECRAGAQPRAGERGHRHDADGGGRHPRRRPDRGRRLPASGGELFAGRGGRERHRLRPPRRRRQGCDAGPQHRARAAAGGARRSAAAAPDPAQPAQHQPAGAPRRPRHPLALRAARRREPNQLRADRQRRPIRAPPSATGSGSPSLGA